MKTDITVSASLRRIKCGKQTRERLVWAAETMETLAASFAMLKANNAHAEAAAKAIRQSLAAIDGMEAASALEEAHFAAAK